ncbi:DUF2304 domain-containing protein [Pseudonocardiaceae bacterium YIM PH 21723]|nr:DUF2304 domain-containing protein [Pseudonocardiaceae bacterium YIM PH 21723]
MTAYIIGVLGSLFILASIFEMLRRRQLTEKYAFLWLISGLVVLVLTFIGPTALRGLTLAIGFTVPSNLLFFVAIVFLIGVALHLSWELSRVEGETRKLNEDLAILQLEVETLKAGQKL